MGDGYLIEDNSQSTKYPEQSNRNYLTTTGFLNAHRLRHDDKQTPPSGVATPA